tara:strand:+ start:36152 stop:37051 length:900 start_codon:yes stop_codon:yes gene_type:complete
MFYVSLFIYIFFIAATAMADVKKEFGEFLITHSEKTEKQILVSRHYSSRSLYKGVFGFNWCSNLDYKINMSDDEMSLFDCELSKRVTFKRISPNQFENKENQLKLSIKDHLIQYEKSTITYFFSMDGQLSHWTAVSFENPVYVIYKNGKAHLLMNKKFGSLELKSSGDGLILKIGTEISYEYTQGLLKKVTQSKKTLWQYQYDEFLNMTLWRSPSSFEAMKYDSEWDRITELKDKENCRFRFQYEVKKSKKYILESKKCATQTERETVFEMVSPKMLIQSSSDKLGKEFRQGGKNENVF